MGHKVPIIRIKKKKVSETREINIKKVKIKTPHPILKSISSYDSVNDSAHVNDAICRLPDRIIRKILTLACPSLKDLVVLRLGSQELKKSVDRLLKSTVFPIEYYHETHGPYREMTSSPETFAHMIRNSFKQEKPYHLDDLACYLSTQTDINIQMRAILIDWLVNVSIKYYQEDEVLHMATNYIDRYLAQEKIPRSRLQLIALAAFWLGSKMDDTEEKYSLGDLNHVCDKAYSKHEILAMERLMLHKLDYRLNTPTIILFQRYFSFIAGFSSKQHHFARYLGDETLIQYRLNRYLPSQLAAAITYLCRIVFKQKPYWTYNLEYHTGYSLMELEKCIKDVFREHQKLCSSTDSLKAIRNKWSKNKRDRVSIIYSLPDSLPRELTVLRS